MYIYIYRERERYYAYVYIYIYMRSVVSLISRVIVIIIEYCYYCYNRAMLQAPVMIIVIIIIIMIHHELYNISYKQLELNKLTTIHVLSLSHSLRCRSTRRLGDRF